MPKKTCKCKEGSPEWMTTFADMVTLLLCFFVLIVSFSEIKKEDQYMSVVEHIQEAFGMMGGGGRLPTDDDPALSLIQRLEALRLQNERVPNRSNIKDPGQTGRESRVTTIREGTQYAVGGGVRFEPDSAELTLEARAALIDLVERNNLTGTKNKIQLTGHAGALELLEPGVAPSEDRTAMLNELGYRRASAVFTFLTGPDMPEGLRLDPDRFRIGSSGASEPINARAQSSADARVNRRVDVVVSENVVEDFQDNGAGQPAMP